MQVTPQQCKAKHCAQQVCAAWHESKGRSYIRAIRIVHRNVGIHSRCRPVSNSMFGQSPYQKSVIPECSSIWPDSSSQCMRLKLCSEKWFCESRSSYRVIYEKGSASSTWFKKVINRNYCLRTFLVLCKYLNMSTSVSLDRIPHTTSRMKSDMMASVASTSCSI